MNNPFSGNVKELGIISVIIIIVISYSLFFYLQNITENNIKIRLFDQQKERQLESTKVISQHVRLRILIQLGQDFKGYLTLYIYKMDKYLIIKPRN